MTQHRRGRGSWMGLNQLQVCVGVLVAMVAGVGSAEQVPASRSALAAANMHFAEALADADADDLAGAKQSLERALAYDPQHTLARQALALLDDPAGQGTPVAKAFAAGMSAADARQWQQAIDAFAYTIELDRHHLPARAWRKRSQHALSTATDLKAAGRAFLEQRHIDRAIQALTEVRQIDPHNAAVEALLDQALKLRHEADSLLVGARQALEEGRWDAALGRVAEARAFDPHHPDARMLHQAIVQAAADHHNRLGRSAFDAGRFADADAAYADALSYLPEHRGAKLGRRDTAMAMAHAARRAGRWGAAYVHAYTADMLASNDETRHALVEAGDRLADRVTFGLRLTADTHPGDWARLEQRIRSQLIQSAPAWVIIDPGIGQHPAFVLDARLAVPSFETDTRLLGSVDRIKPYTVETPTPNPALPALEQAVLHAAQRLRDLENAASDQWLAYHRLIHRVSREDNATLRTLARTARAQAQRLDRMAREARAELRHAEHTLAAAPPFIIIRETMQWNYTVQTHQQIASLSAVASLFDGEERIGRPTVVEKRFTEQDTTLDPANPAIGLAADPLTLTDHIHIKSLLLDEAASEMAQRLLADALRARAYDRLLEARSLHHRQLHAQAAEATAEAAVLLMPIDPEEARRHLLAAHNTLP